MKHFMHLFKNKDDDDVPSKQHTTSTHINKSTFYSTATTIPKSTYSAAATLSSTPVTTEAAQNLEGITLIWYDPTIDKNKDTQQTMNELREVNDYIVFHTIEEECLNHIKAIKDEKVFLVTSGRCAEHISREVNNLKSVDSVFIFCLKPEKYQHLLGEFTKIIGIYNERPRLIDAIKENIKLVEKQLQTFSFYNQHGEKSTRDLSKESAEFLWFQMFKDMIMRLPRDMNAKQQLIEFCRHYYRGNKKELAFIDEFKRTYRPEDAIKWYTRETFLYKLVNKALRTENIEQLHVFRFFISDLSSSLAAEYRKGKDKDKSIVRLYRGLKMEKDEILLLKHNAGNLISTNGFLSTSRSRDLARNFAMKTTKRTNVVSVLYEIQCNVQELNRSVMFADISQYSDYPNEEEVLFDIGATFKIVNVKEDYSGLWTIHMKATNEGTNVAEEYIELNRKDEEETSVVLMFGKLLQDMGLYDESLKYFQNLLSNNSQDEDIARIYNLMGTAYHNKKDFDKALENYKRSYDMMMNAATLLSRTKDSARPLMNIGLIYHQRGEYDRSLELYFKALKIFEKYYGKNHLKTTKVLTNIGNSYVDRGQYHRGLTYFENVLKIQEEFLPQNHMDTALTLNNIAVVYQKMNELDLALEYYERSLEMKKRLLPSEHKDIYTTLMNIKSITDKKPTFLSVSKPSTSHWPRLHQQCEMMAMIEPEPELEPELQRPVIGMKLNS